MRDRERYCYFYKLVVLIRLKLNIHAQNRLARFFSFSCCNIFITFLIICLYSFKIFSEDILRTDCIMIPGRSG